MKLDQILRLNRFDRSSDLVRIKAIIVTTIMILGVQAIAFSYQTYLTGFDWTYTGLVIGSSIAVLLLVLSFRYHNKFYLAGLGYTLVFAGMVFMVASVKKMGVQSSLVPYLPLAVIISGFISGWRMTLVSGSICLAVTAALFGQSAMYSGDGTIVSAFANPILIDKALQLALSCGMAIVIAGTLSVSMHGLFKRDEESVIKVQKAERQRSAFLSSLSHEIRTPLNGVIGMSSLLKHTELDTQQAQYANMVHQCGENLLDVLSTVMEFNQINYNRIVLNNESFDVHSLAHEMVRKYSSRLPSGSDVIMGLHIAEDVPQYLFADRARLETILNHILRNAVQFTPSGSINLLLNGSKVDDKNFRLCIYVRDTGIGIRKHQLKDIYQPFHQLDNNLSRQHEGTGLGLSLCKEIIEFMDGSINVVSEFGSGSTFFFEVVLPVSERSEFIQTNTNADLAQAQDLSNVAIFKKTG